MKANGSVVLGIIALIMVCFACVVLVLYRVGGGRNSTSKTVRYAGRLGKLLFAASVVLIAIGLILVPSGEGYMEEVAGDHRQVNPEFEGDHVEVNPSMHVPSSESSGIRYDPTD